MACADAQQIEPLGGDTDVLDRGEESDLEDELLAEFYAFTYEDAVLVGPSGSSPPKPSGKHSPLRRPPSPTRPTGSPSKGGQLHGPTATHVAAAATSAVAAAEAALSREILNAMLPPKTWRDASGKWQRVVRLSPSTRSDVQRLDEVFAQLLEEHQARASAICPVREKFFLQVFEELIRESACECPERGLLLLRLRDELRMAIEGYQTLYHNSIAYGRHKAVQAEAGIVELEDRIQRLHAQHHELLERRQRLAHRVQLVEAEAEEDRQKRELAQRQRLQFLQDQHAQLQTFHLELTQETTWK